MLPSVAISAQAILAQAPSARANTDGASGRPLTCLQLGAVWCVPLMTPEKPKYSFVAMSCWQVPEITMALIAPGFTNACTLAAGQAELGRPLRPQSSLQGMDEPREWQPNPEVLIQSNRRQERQLQNPVTAQAA